MSENNSNDISRRIAAQQCIINRGGRYPSVKVKDNLAMAISKLLFWLVVFILAIGVAIGSLAGLLCGFLGK